MIGVPMVRLFSGCSNIGVQVAVLSVVGSCQPLYGTKTRQVNPQSFNQNQVRQTQVLIQILN